MVYPSIAPFRQKRDKKYDKVHEDYKCKEYKKQFTKTNDFYAKKKNVYKKKDKQKPNKGNCFNYGKYGHFSKDCNKMGRMSMVANAYITNHNLDHAEIVDLLTTGFSGTFHGWWEKYLTKESRESIKKAVKKDDDGLPIFDERVGQGIPNRVNTLIYTIIKHFVGAPFNISSRISDYSNNLRCPTKSDYRWYQYVFISRVMFQKDYLKPYWKEKFIAGLPPLFAHKVKEELIDKNGIINYDD